MKASEFKAVIRALVIEEVQREVAREVAKQLPKMLFEMLGQKATVPTQQTVVREDIASDPDALPIPRKATPPINTNVPQKKVIKKYARDPILNAILNETTSGLPQTGIDTGVPIPNFSKVGVSQEFIGEMKEILNESNAPQIEPVQHQVEEVVEEAPAGPDLSKLFNKNFKAILDKSKKGHSGNFSGAIQSW
jgi:hypothetical protein